MKKRIVLGLVLALLPSSAWALEITRKQTNVEVVALLTTVNTTHGRVAMHAVREFLLEQLHGETT